MSEQFRNLRHLTTHVDEQVRIYTQLQEAIRSVGGILDALPEKKKEIEVLDMKADEIRKTCADQDAAQQVIAENFRLQRRENQALLQKEQQERVGAREAFRLEQQTWRQETEQARALLADLQREIERRRGEAATLEKELASTVKAVLRR